MLKKPVLILVVVCLIFLGVYFWLVTPISTDKNLEHRFDWPDETANYFWSKHFAQTNQLFVAEPLNLVAQNQIHPRSFNVRPDGSLVPGSFLGLILLYGTMAKLFGTKIIIYLTPIFSILGVLGLYGIIKRIFTPRIALISSLLLLFNPAWWYYSVTSMLPNVTFISLVILSIYFLLQDEFRLKAYQLLLAAFCLGLAASIRPVEALWVFVVYLAVAFYIRHKLNLKQVLLFGAIVALVVSPVLFQQQSLYGGYLSSGYDQLSQTQTSPTQVIKSLVMPFGFHPLAAATNFWTYYLSSLWWLSLITALGLAAFLSQATKQKTEVFAYILLSLFVFGWLILYYGSWEFSDRLTASLNTLGLSYVRYWLPLYILALPFTAIGLIFLTQFLKSKIQNAGLIVLLVAMLYPSWQLTLNQKADSLLPVRQRIASYKQNAQQVIEATPSGAVIVTSRKDKLFFPERKVVHTFNALADNSDLSQILLDLTRHTPVYYYALAASEDLKLANGLELIYVQEVDKEVLYKIQ